MPPAHGASARLSPQQLIRGITPDAKLHCRIPFGGYAQVTQPTSNNVLHSRTVGAICLGPKDNVQGTHKWMSLLTGEFITRNIFTPMPMPDDVVARVNELGKFEEIIFTDRDGVVDPQEWIDTEAGKEYIDDQDHQDELLDADEEVHAQELNDLQEDDPRDRPPSDSTDDSDYEESEEPEDQGQTTGVEDPSETPGVPTNSMDTNNVNTNQQPKYTTRYGRVINPPNRYGRMINPNNKDYVQHDYNVLCLIFADDEIFIPPDTVTMSMQEAFGLDPKCSRDEMYSFAQILHQAFTQVSLKQGLKKWGKDAAEATMAKMQQLHKNVVEPVKWDDLTREEKSQALRSMIFLKQKRCGRIKAKTCADGRPQHYLYDKMEASSPTVKTESVLLSAVIDATEDRYIAVCDIPGAFLRAYLDEDVHMMMEGALADLMIKVAPDMYGPTATTNAKGQTVLYVKLTRALYGCLKSALKFWEQLSGILEDDGYVINPYDRCVANKIINGKQCTIMWHVDDLKISHKEKTVVEQQIRFLESIYGPISSVTGKVHTYLGIDMDFTTPGEVKLSMVDYLKEVIEDFPEPITGSANTPAADHLFEQSNDPNYLEKRRPRHFITQ